MKRLTLNEFVKKARTVHGEKYDYSKTVYSGSKVKCTIICPKHGEFQQIPNMHLLGQGCPKCGSAHGAKKLQLTTQEFVKKAQAAHSDKYDYSKVEYKGTAVVVTIGCQKHGDFQQTPNAHLRGKTCPYCAQEGKRLSQDEFLERCRKVHGDKYDYSKVEYTGANYAICIICPIHGDFVQTAGNHLYQKHGCHKCGWKPNQKTTADFVKSAVNVHKGKYSYLETEYKHVIEPVIITCPKHGNFKQTPAAHLQGYGCQRCGKDNKVSNVEQRVVSWLRRIKIPVKQQVSLDKQSIDIYLPEHKLGIEINGLYWHSERFKTQSYHQEKSALAENLDIQLMHFWEHQINNKAPIVKSMIRNKLGLAKLRIFARECSVQTIDKESAKEFLEANHIQGYVSASVCYGLFLDEQLVSAMTFGKPRFNKEYQWEIIRLATLRNTVVVGGASRMFAAFVKENSPKSVISYADLDYANGGVYKNLGFSFSNYAAPSYFWVKGHTALPRYRAQKHKLHNLLGEKFDPNLSESENMRSSGFSKVFNSGNAVFTWTAKC